MGPQSPRAPSSSRPPPPMAATRRHGGSSKLGSEYQLACDIDALVQALPSFDEPPCLRGAAIGGGGLLDEGARGDCGPMGVHRQAAVDIGDREAAGKAGWLSLIHISEPTRR